MKTASIKSSVFAPLFPAAGLALLGYAGNYLSMPVAYGVSFIFGSIFSIIAIRLYGLRWGTAVALVASSYTLLLWNHPYAIIIFAAEAVWIGLALSRGRTNILLIDSLYWLCLGVPLVALFYFGVMGLGFQSTLIIALKQSINGIINALVASLILSCLPVDRWLRTGKEPVRPTFATILFHLTSTSLMLPAIGILFYYNHRDLTLDRKSVV